jgi:hypothetical protein
VAGGIFLSFTVFRQKTMIDSNHTNPEGSKAAAFDRGVFSQLQPLLCHAAQQRPKSVTSGFNDAEFSLKR